MKYFTKDELKQERGSVTVEFALVLPLFMMVMGGIYDLASFGMLSSKVTRIAGVIGDTVSRDDLTRTKLRAIMGTADKMARPYDFVKGSGDVIVTQVTNDGETTNPANMVISWQESLSGSTSDYGMAGGAPENLPGDITVIEDQSMILTEVSYVYKPVFIDSIFGTKTIRETSVFAPRSSKMDRLVGE
tara:strand:- start:751 stop:1314 length:564 start_codon:yes stop_codon:yes gene_type:complete